MHIYHTHTHTNTHTHTDTTHRQTQTHIAPASPGRSDAEFVLRLARAEAFGALLNEEGRDTLVFRGLVRRGKDDGRVSGGPVCNPVLRPVENLRA